MRDFFDRLFTWTEFNCVSFRVQIPFVFVHVSELFVHDCEFDFVVFVDVALGSIVKIVNEVKGDVVWIFEWNAND